MLTRILRTIPILLFVVSSWADALPGFALQEVTAPTDGFITSIAFDASGVLHYTTMDGGVFRHEDGEDREVARVDSANEGNAAFLGMAFAPDGTIVVHYVSSDLVADVVSRIDLETGEETILAHLPCSPNGSPCPTEHHGGNPDVAADGAIYFGIGDYGLLNIAQYEDVNAAKIYRIDPDGTVEIWAMGFRNPFDLAWDERYGRIIAEDNGASGASDEIVFVQPGENHGWPRTMGNDPPVEGMTPPVFVFPERTAPTGLDLANADEGWFRDGILVTSFVTRALYYFPSYDEISVASPIVIVEGETTPLIDVRQAPNGDVYVASGFRVLRLVTPEPGDVDGNGEVDKADFSALREELNDFEGGSRTIDAPDGAVCSSWGADVDQNGVIDADDLAELARRLSTRRRAATHHPGASRGHPVTRHISD